MNQRTIPGDRGFIKKVNNSFHTLWDLSVKRNNSYSMAFHSFRIQYWVNYDYKTIVIDGFGLEGPYRCTEMHVVVSIENLHDHCCLATIRNLQTRLDINENILLWCMLFIFIAN